MPLFKGKSKKAFSKNVEAEMDEGKPQKQSLAIAYSMAKRSGKKKMAEGGLMDALVKGLTPGDSFSKVKKAEGGMIHAKDSGFVDHEGNEIKHNGPSISEDDRSLNQHGELEEGPQGGGEGFHDESYMGHKNDPHDNYQSEDHELDMLTRIMNKEKMYSQGGKVANGGDDDLDMMADGKPNNFDDLALRDDLESSYDGSNAGDHLGNDQEDSDRKDMVSRIMASERKKDKLPKVR